MRLFGPKIWRGFAIKTIPINPLTHMKTSYHLSLSFNMRNAKIIVKIGFVKKMIIASERVSNLRVVRVQPRPTNPVNPLIIKYFTSDVLRLDRLIPTIER